ncbi:hypothetical protein CABS01_14480 [Colletotrichum abscissum]|uniref:Uncharacterized protein n=1 Tax=Colletotrichum abscissum TaxID=1671311 RepID=A0A9Q0B4W7_9PEZI|nr:uncharacterized protein CABS01_14480 [Colletotrichum abscissum]KAI3553324.1 hypothetical protein CABS02_06465 [Colletotrichum abscissum]KAK1480342.1 hypothetical protein CABS01_14480 [Colletotrichum abscissum]
MRRRDEGKKGPPLHRIGLETGDGRERVRRWQAGQGPRGHTDIPHQGRGVSIGGSGHAHHHHHHHHLLPQHLKIKMEGTDTEYPARILDDDLTRGNGGSSSFEARLVSIVHGTMNTSDSIHLQAARRTPREDLELYFSDGAYRHSLALTQYATVLH